VLTLSVTKIDNKWSDEFDNEI